MPGLGRRSAGPRSSPERRSQCNSPATSLPGPAAGAPSTAKTAIWGWLAFVIVAVFVGGAVGNEDARLRPAPGSASRVAPIGDARRRPSPTTPARPCWSRARAHRPRSRAFRAAVDATVEQRLAALPRRRQIEGPYGPGTWRRSRADGHSALITFEIPGDDSTSPRRGSTPRWPRSLQRAGQPRLRDRGVRRSERRQGAEQGFEDDFRRPRSPRCRSRC